MRRRTRRRAAAVVLALPWGLLASLRLAASGAAFLDAASAGRPGGPHRAAAAVGRRAAVAPLAEALLGWPGALLAAARAAEAGEQPGGLSEAAARFPLVLDETGLLSPSTERYIDGALKQLQADTGLKVRVICPPSGLQDNRTAFRDYLRPINRKWETDSSSLVIVAEDRVQKRSGRQLRLLSIQPGYKLQERFQYRLTQDFIIGTADRFGFPQTVSARGADICIREAALSVVAALYDLVEDPKSRYLTPADPNDVSAILKRHGLEL